MGTGCQPKGSLMKIKIYYLLFRTYLLLCKKAGRVSTLLYHKHINYLDLYRLEGTKK